MPTTSRIAVQMYTLRAFTKTPADIAKTLKRVRQIGYEAIQISAFGPIDPRELKTILDGEGLSVCATHVGWDRLTQDLPKLAAEHHLWGCKYPAVGSMPGNLYPRTREGFVKFARDAGEVAKKCQAEGLVFGYHNHDFEFEKFDGKTGMELLIENSDPSLTFELDTYWVQSGGGDPAAWINRVAGRIPLVHLKDMAYGRDTTVPAPAKFEGEPDDHYQKRVATHNATKRIMAEIGEGNINFSTVLAACAKAGTIWYIIEQDVCQRDPFESLAISLKNCKAMGLR